MAIRTRVPRSIHLHTSHHPPTGLGPSPQTINRPHRSGFSTSAARQATLLRRPKTPYTFTQLVTLSDGSAYLHRTTSPAPVYRSIRDVRNTVLWNPSSLRLTNVEEDEAGRLAKFRERFGRGWDVRSMDQETADEPSSTGRESGNHGDKKESAATDKRESLLDLISGYSAREGDAKVGRMVAGLPGKKK